MTSQEKLFEAFGELLYVMAMADGQIQQEEKDIIEKRLLGHKWAPNIHWSFNYEVEKKNSLDDLYKKVVFYCEEHGPDEEYTFLVQMLEDVAGASDGIHKEEQAILDNFVKDLTEVFRKSSI